MTINKSRRKFMIGAALSVGSIGLGAVGLKINRKISKAASPSYPPVIPKPRLGINLNGITDWNAELPFVNLFWMSRTWDSVRMDDNKPGPALDLDSQGWVKQLPPNCFARTGVISVDGGHYPSGRYVILFEGEGELRLMWAATDGDIISKSKGRIEFQLNAKNGTFALDLIKTNPQNYLRNIRVVMPGFENSYQQQPWHEAFLSRWRGVACIRFMDMMATNGSKQIHWRDRAKVDDARFSTKGLPVELLVDLANQLNADPWFCIPHQANDEYVAEFAAYVKAHLNPKLKAWVEYSNELWNFGFEQIEYANTMGMQLKLSNDKWEAGKRYVSHRSVEIFSIWERVFGGTQRFVRVLASQAANAYLSEELLSYKDTAKKVDVLAIAPYISMNVAPESDEGLSERHVQHWGVDQVFYYINRVALPHAIEWVKQSKSVADRFGVRLVAYEAGQHLAGVAGSENNETIEKLLRQANGDKRMGEVYQSYLRSWQTIGGDLICFYNSTSAWSKWGSWGTLQYYDDPIDTAYKYKAIVDWAKLNGQGMGY